MRDIRSLPIALALVVLASGTASAALGLATADVNVRQGPGTNFPVVTMIRAGSNLDVGRCDVGWCAVRFGRFAGFVNASFLNFGPGPRYYAAPLAPRYYGPPPRYWGPRPYYWGWGPGLGRRRPYWGW